MTKPTPLFSIELSLLIVALGSVLVWVLLGRPATGIDDADIFFVYARNFAEGHGFVYNVGGERVEGFTSMLWTLICAGGMFVFRSVEIPLFLLNVVLGAIAVGACLRRTDHPGVFILILAAVPAWFAWCQVTLMESGLWCLLITLLVLAVAEQRRKAMLLLLPLLVFTRPESMVWGAWFILVFATGKSWRESLILWAVFGASLLALVSFRLWYFGYPVPNTYYAKVSTDWLSNIGNGLHYFWAYVTSNPWVTISLILWLGVLVRGVFRSPRAWSISTRIAVCLLPGMGIPILVGGDHFGASRFYQPLWPLLCLLAVGEWSVRVNPLVPRFKWMLLGVLLAVGWLAFPHTANLKHEFRIAKEGRGNGVALTHLFNDLETWPSVAVITAGGNKLGYPGPVFDLMGLNSTEMAHAPSAYSGVKNHSAFNREVFYRWSPNILLCGDSPEFDTLVLKGLPNEPRFKVLYSKNTLHRNGAEIEAYFLNDFLMKLPNLGIQSAE